MKLVAAGILAVAVLFPSPAGAAPPSAVEGRPAPREALESRETTPERAWYGWQIILVDLAAIGSSVGGLVEFGTPVGPYALAAGLGTFALGAPLLHVIHDRPGVAAGSVALRLGLPCVAALAGFEGAGGGWGGVGYGLLGALGAMVTASAIDSGALSWSNPRVTAPSTPRLGLAPTRGGLSLGLSGAF